MRPLLLLLVFASCSESTDVVELRPEEQVLLGCWEGEQGTKLVQHRFHEDRSVDSRVIDGAWHTGTFVVDGDALTYDFGEEPPTYHIDVTTTTFSYRELPFTFTRIRCPR